jgi:hypothetical protein
MHNDQIIHSLIAACRTANEKWKHEDAIYIHVPGRGRAAPPVQIACDAFVDANAVLIAAVPKTLEGWRAKWREFHCVEVEYAGWTGESDYRDFIGQMLGELAVLVPVKAAVA